MYLLVLSALYKRIKIKLNMKNHFLTVKAIFILGVVLFSCSEEDEILAHQEVNATSIVSITSDYYRYDNLYSSATTNFVDGKPITIKYSDKRYDSIIFEGDMILKILEFDSNKNLEWTTTYDYDRFDRLTLKNVFPSPNNAISEVSRQKSFIYDEGLIRSENSWSDGGFHKNTIILNNESFIVEDILINADNLPIKRSIFEYANGNLTKHITKNHKDEVIHEQTFNYLDKTASKAYRYDEFLFGNEWKNNSSLNKQFGLGQFKSYEISKNYISEYNSYSSETGIFLTSTFSYEFGSDEKITKQTENISRSTGDKYKVITTYFYE